MDFMKKLNPFKRHRPTPPSESSGNQTHQQQQQQHLSDSKRKAADKELHHLNQKIEKILANLDENEADGDFSPEEECVVCLSAKATMRTYPCGHCVVCRLCFVKTIQSAVADRRLPLKCVVCRTKILKLKQQRARSTGSQTRAQRSAPSHNLITTVTTSSQSAKQRSSSTFNPCRPQPTIQRPLLQRPTIAPQKPTATKLMQPLLIYPATTTRPSGDGKRRPETGWPPPATTAAWTEDVGPAAAAAATGAMATSSAFKHRTKTGARACAAVSAAGPAAAINGAGGGGAGGGSRKRRSVVG